MSRVAMNEVLTSFFSRNSNIDNKRKIKHYRTIGNIQLVYDTSVHKTKTNAVQQTTS